MAIEFAKVGQFEKVKVRALRGVTVNMGPGNAPMDLAKDDIAEISGEAYAFLSGNGSVERADVAAKIKAAEKESAEAQKKQDEAEIAAARAKEQVEAKQKAEADAKAKADEKAAAAAEKKEAKK